MAPKAQIHLPLDWNVVVGTMKLHGRLLVISVMRTVGSLLGQSSRSFALEDTAFPLGPTLSEFARRSHEVEQSQLVISIVAMVVGTSKAIPERRRHRATEVEGVPLDITASLEHRQLARSSVLRFTPLLSKDGSQGQHVHTFPLLLDRETLVNAYPLDWPRIRTPLGHRPFVALAINTLNLSMDTLRLLLLCVA